MSARLEAAVGGELLASEPASPLGGGDVESPELPVCADPELAPASSVGAALVSPPALPVAPLGAPLAAVPLPPATSAPVCALAPLALPLVGVPDELPEFPMALDGGPDVEEPHAEIAATALSKTSFINKTIDLWCELRGSTET